MPETKFTEAELKALSEMVSSDQWQIVRKVFKEQQDFFYGELDSAEKDHRYFQGRLHGLRLIWNRIAELGKPGSPEQEIEIADATEAAWVRQGRSVAPAEEEELSEAGWFKR